MKTYEMLYVLDTAVADEAKEAIEKRFEDIITSSNGTIVSVEKQGVKKLAYAINYKTEGYYVVLTFEAEGSVIKELDRVAGLNVQILRKLILAK